MKQDLGAARWTGFVLAVLCVAMAALLAHGLYATFAGTARLAPDDPAVAPRAEPSAAPTRPAGPRTVAVANAAAETTAALPANAWGATRGAM